MLTDKQLKMIKNHNVILSAPILRSTKGVHVAAPYVTRCGDIHSMVKSISAMYKHTYNDSSYNIKATLYDVDSGYSTLVPLEDILCLSSSGEDEVMSSIVESTGAEYPNKLSLVKDVYTAPSKDTYEVPVVEEVYSLTDTTQFTLFGFEIGAIIRTREA